MFARHRYPWILVMALALGGCPADDPVDDDDPVNDDENDNDDDDDNDEDVDDLDFVDIHPILWDRCESCHGAASTRDFVLTDDLDEDYDVTLDFVDMVEPEDSELLLKGTATVDHAGGEALPEGSQDYDSILEWIEEGAPFEL